MRFLICLLFCSLCFSQVEKFDKKGNLTHYADTLNGMFNGKVMIYNKNKTIAIQGNFIDNQKNGIWIFNDSIGKLKYKRNYQSNYEFENLIVKNDTTPKYILGRNKNNGINFPRVEYDEIYYGRNEWWFLENNKMNSNFFKDDLVFNSLKEYIKKDTIEVYTNTNFTERLSKEEIYKRFEKFDSEIIGYKMKRFYYYNDKFKISETRILGICPVIKASENDSLIDLFWIYYPNFGDSNTLQKSIKNNVSDLFEFNAINAFLYFREHVTKEENSEDLIEKLKQNKLDTYFYELDKISNEARYFNFNLREMKRKQKLDWETNMTKYNIKKQ